MYKKLFIFILVMVLGINNVSAFSESFNNLDAWTVTAGSYNVRSSGSIDGTNYAYNTLGTSRMNTPDLVSHQYFSADFNTTAAGTQLIEFQANSTSSRCMKIQAGPNFMIASGSLGSCLTNHPGYTAVPISLNSWYRVTINDTGANEIVTLTNLSNGSVFNTQTISKPTPVIGFDRWEITSASLTWQVDNLLGSAFPVESTTNVHWNLDEYTRGDTASFSWSITDSDWASFDRYFIRLYKNGILQDFSSFNVGCLCFTQLSLGTQTGTYSLLADEPGTWQVTLEKATAASLWTSFVIINTDDTRIRDYSSSYFLIPGTALIKTNVSVTYHIGIGGVQSGIEWFYLNNGIEQRERGINLGTTTDGTINVTFSKVGTYNVYLKSLTGTAQTFDTHTIITSFISGGTPSNNFHNSTIHLLPVNGTGGSGATYAMNEVLYGNYTINGTKFSGEGVFFIDVYNNDSGAETAVFFEDFGGSIGLLDNGLYAYLISNNANQPNGQLTQFQPGNNSIRLMLQNPDFTYTVLATDQFVLSRTNTAGYGLDVNPLNVAVGQNVNAVVTSPVATGSYLRITGKNNYNKTYPLTAGTRTITSTFDTPGIYGYNLYDPTGNVQMTTQVTVTSGPTPTPTPTIQASSEITSLMSSKIFWALLFILGIMLAIAVKERSGR